MLPLVAFTGRFQPFHSQHLEMVRFALQRATRVLIGITNPEDDHHEHHPTSSHRHLDESNPLSVSQRQQLIEAALFEDGISASCWQVFPFPLDRCECWPLLIPPGTPQLVRVFSAWEREKVRRFEAAGYPPLVVEGDLANRLSASEIRQTIRTSGRVPESVPLGARELLGSWLSSGIGVLHGR